MRSHRRVILSLTALATLLTIGHHVDHLIRGNHVGWPVTDQVTAFTISLLIYPILIVAVALFLAGRIGPGSWAFISGGGAVFVGVLHFGPLAVEPPQDILGEYDAAAGTFWMGWLVLLVITLAVTCVVETSFWLRERQAAHRVAQRG